VTGSVNDGDIVLLSLELPQSDIDGDTTLALGLELVKNPGILERTLAEFGGFLLLVVSINVAYQIEDFLDVGSVRGPCQFVQRKWGHRVGLPLQEKKNPNGGVKLKAGWRETTAAT